MKVKLSKSEKKAKRQARRVTNLNAIDDAIAKCASFVGLPKSKYSTLELVICVSAKLDVVVRGDIHPNQQIKSLARRLAFLKTKKPCVVVNRTRKEFFNSRSWKILRYQAFEKYGNKCCCCGGSPSDGLTMHVDHILPKSTHPESALDLNNLQILCEDCNVGKINQWETDWRP